ncbi:MAG TPA: lytic transglycosylase domain-containing protein, partial [Clostridia bacterium]|nr:lytic transglycosylase domain-containing protein [Clostridia bacterium]
EEVPRDMMWVGLVESGYNPIARSPKNALGIWQFIPATAERFGLQTGHRDERIDPTKSTRAAAQYLKFLYNTFRDWPLALAAYNAGENRVASAIQRTGVRDFWELARVGALPRETQDYVPAVLAAGLMEKGSKAANHASVPPAAKASSGKQVQAPIAIVTEGAGGI